MAESNWFRKAIQLQILVTLTRLYILDFFPPPYFRVLSQLTGCGKNPAWPGYISGENKPFFFLFFFAVIQ